MSDTLFNRLGGKAAVEAAVDIFYEKVLADENLKPFFANTEMTGQRAKQKAFMTYAFGGAPNYSGRSMRAAHADAVKDGLSDHHFDAVAGHLQSTLEQLAVPAELTAEVMALVGSTRGEVLNR